MKKILCILLLASAGIHSLSAQSSVAIGDSNPKASAVLYLKGNGSQGLIIPIVSNTTSIATPESGMIVYNSGDKKVYYHDGAVWTAVGSGSGGGSTYTLSMSGNNLLLRDATSIVSTVPIAATAPTAANQFLTWDGSRWVATAFSQDVSNANGVITVNGIKGKTVPALPSSTQALVYNGSAWVFQPLTGGTDSQDLSLNTTTDILSLTNDATTVDLSGYKQDLSFTGTGSVTTGESFPLAISSGTGITIREGANVQIDQAANVLTINSVAGGSGTVTNVSVLNANGFNGTVNTSTTTPAITLTTPVTGIIKGNGTAMSAAVAGTDYLTPTGSAAGLTAFPILNQNTTGTASTITGNITESQVTNLTTDLANKVTGNTAITAGTNTKITYDAKGLVTGGAALAASDLPIMTATAGGAVPTPPNNTTTFLRGDGTFATPAGAGTVTAVSVTTANGVSGTVATPTSTPAISITLGAITPTSVAAAGTVTGSNLSGTNTGDNAVNSLYSGLVSNATHTGDATGSTALQVRGINGVLMSGLGTGMLKNTTGTGVPSIATGADLPPMTATVGGAVPTPPNNTTTFLRGDGTFATPAGGGTLTAVSVATANGFSGSSSGGATPALTIVAGAITPTSVAASGTVTGSNLSGTNTGDNAVNSLYSGLVSNATHTGDATGSTALQVRGINGILMSGLGTGILKNTTGTGVPSIATGADLPPMTATVGGAVPTPPNNTTTFLRGDGTFATPAAGGTVTTVSVTTANGVSGTVTTPTTTPAITLTLGAITPTSVVASGTVTGSNVSGTNTGDNAVNSLYSGLVSNATHTGDATGSTALTVVRINGVSMAGLATGVLKNTTGTGAPSIATGADLPPMTATVGGAVPTPPNNTTTFLRGDGTFAAPTSTGWSLTGNPGTAVATNFIGTTDDEPLEIKVNNTRVGRYELNTTPTTAGLLSPNIIQGYFQNTAAAGVKGSVISGGGLDNFHTVDGDWATIGGGRDNHAGTMAPYAAYATVGGGASNSATAQWSTIGGGKSNVALGNASAIPGGSWLITESFGSTVVGTANVDPAGSYSTGTWVTTEPIFIIGNGQITGPNLTSRSNAMVVLKNGNVGIGSSTPTQILDVVGNVKFSGAIMPNNLPGVSGQVLTSQGANVPPVWTTPGGGTLISNPGTLNLFAGVGAGSSNTGSNNAIYGATAGAAASNGINNSFFGTAAGNAVTTGDDNTFVGRSAGLRINTGGFNVFVGKEAGQLSTADGNSVFVGYRAGYTADGGNGNTLIGSQSGTVVSGGLNTFVGVNAGQAASTGTNNTFMGNASGATVSTASNVTLIGATTNVTGVFNNATAIGYGAVVNAGNKVRIGNTTVTVIEGQVAFTAASDRRFKKDIKDIDEGLDFISKLRPVSYRMKEGDNRTNWGFIAQDVETLVGTENAVLTIGGDSDRSLGLRYTDFVAPLVKSIQEQQDQIEELKKVILELEAKLKVYQNNENTELALIREQIKMLSDAVGMEASSEKKK